MIRELWVTPDRGGRPVAVDAIGVTPNVVVGYTGDRYHLRYAATHHHRGTVTLVECLPTELAALTHGAHRRNIVMDYEDDLGLLLGRAFRLGDYAVLRADERCEPCARLAKLTGRPMASLRDLVHTGLRCTILKPGTFTPGDKIGEP